MLGVLVPKRIAMKNYERMALSFAGLLSLVTAVLSPFVWFLTVSTNAILRLIGIDPNELNDEVTEEEIRMMVDAGSEKGTIDSDEKEFIQNVFEFDDTDVGEICTHRKEVETLWLEDDMTVWNDTINNSRRSKFPVCKENADDVVGILDVKDYYRLTDKTRANVMKHCVEEPQFVLETTKADVMFEKMKKSRNYFAVVLDEYGGMCGIITLNDLVQQIMGELLGEDEEDDGEDITRLDENSWRILGETPIKDVCEELDVTIPDDEYDTFGGFIFGCLGSIPEDGSRFEIEANSMRINVNDVKNHCVVSANVCLVVEDEEAEKEA
jgi:putative hemolysin